MKKKKLLIGIIIASLIIIVVGIVLLVHNSKINTTEKIGTKNGFQIFSTDYVKLDKKKTNIVVWYGKDGLVKTEHTVKKGTKLRINQFGFHYVTINNIDNEKVVISMDGLAPTKKDNSFDMTKKYKNITIDKNTGLQLNVQQKDLYEGYVYFFYIKK